MTSTGQRPHLNAEITFLRTMEGGLQGPVRSGQHLQFYYDVFAWDAIHIFPGREWVYPGQTVSAAITFLSSDSHGSGLYVGKQFEIREGTHVIARGRVTGLLDLK